MCWWSIEDALCSLHRVARRWFAHQRAGSEGAAGQIWIKRVVRNGRQGRDLVDANCDLEKAVDGVLASAFAIRPEVLGVFRAIVDAKFTTSSGEADC